MTLLGRAHPVTAEAELKALNPRSNYELYYSNTFEIRNGDGITVLSVTRHFSPVHPLYRRTCVLIPLHQWCKVQFLRHAYRCDRDQPHIVIILSASCLILLNQLAQSQLHIPHKFVGGDQVLSWIKMSPHWQWCTANNSFEASFKRDTCPCLLAMILKLDQDIKHDIVWPNSWMSKDDAQIYNISIPDTITYTAFH